MYCPNCGNEIKPGEKFCGTCGTKAYAANTDSQTADNDNEIEKLVEHAKNGDEFAFKSLYEKTSKRNYYVALKMVKTDADAQDVLQDAYIRIYQHLDQFTYNGENSFASWSSKIVSNTALNHLRKKQAVLFSDIEGDQEGDFTLEIEDEDESRQPELAYDKKETSQIVQELLGTLSDEQRVCAMMFYYQEQSVKEIASEIGCSENTVKSRLNYARKNMMSKAEDLKKRGILTGILSMAALFAILRSNEAMAMEHVPGTVYAGIQGKIGGNVGTVTSSVSDGVSSSTVGGSSVAGGTAVTGAVVKSSTLLKLIAIVMGAAALISVGIATVLIVSKTNNSDSNTTNVSNEAPASDSVSGSGADAANGDKDVFNEFISSHKFLFDSNEKYPIKAKLIEKTVEEGDKYYEVCNPLELSKPEDIQNNLLGYSIEDYDLDGAKELLVLGTKWNDRTGEDYGLYKTPYSEASLTLEMYENDNGQLIKSSEINDFGKLEFSGGIERWDGSFKCFTYKYKNKQIIALQEEGSDYHARFSDGWARWMFAALTYENNEFKPVKKSYTNILYSGGDESFQCNDDESIYLGDTAKYKIKTLESVGIDYRFGEYMDYLSPEEPEKTMPDEKVKDATTILEEKNTLNESVFEPTQEEISSSQVTIQTISFGRGNNDSKDSDQYEIDENLLKDLEKPFGVLKEKYKWENNNGEWVLGSWRQFPIPNSSLVFIFDVENVNPDKPEEAEVQDNAYPLEIWGTLDGAIPNIKDKSTIKEFVEKLVSSNGKTKHKFIQSPASGYYIGEYYHEVHFSKKYRIEITTRSKKNKKIYKDAGIMISTWDDFKYFNTFQY